MRKKILYTSLIILLIANTVLLYMIVTKDQHKEGKPQKKNFLTEELAFSDKQKDHFTVLDRTHRQKMMKIDDELKNLREQLFNSFGKENFSPDSITNRMGRLETSKQKELHRFFSEVRGICDKNQAGKFDRIINKVLRQRGPKPPRKRKEGPPRENF